MCVVTYIRYGIMSHVYMLTTIQGQPALLYYAQGAVTPETNFVSIGAAVDSVNDLRHEVIFVLDDLAAALAVRVVSEAKDVAVVGQDESVSAAGGHGHGLGLRAVADGQSNTARLDKHFQRVSAPDSVIP